jgi:hypothetical protein
MNSRGAWNDASFAVHRSTGTAPWIGLWSDTPATLQSRPGTRGFDMSIVGGPNPSSRIQFTTALHGRYVRVQLKGTGYLSLAEVQVFGPSLVFQ